MGIMEQAADIVNGDNVKATGDEVVRDRPILSLSRRSDRTESSSAPDMTDGAVRDVPVEVVRAQGGEVSAAEAEPKNEQTASAVSDSASVGDPGARGPQVPVPEASAPRVEETEHEAVEIARKAKDARQGEENSGSSQSDPHAAGTESVDPLDPLSALVAVAGPEERPGASEAGAGGGPADQLSSEETAVTDDPNKSSMDYHEALGRVARHKLRNGHIDIDDRITEYVRTNRREALDRPAPLTVKRELRAMKNGTVDEKLIEARKILEGGIKSKDIDIQVAIQQMEARSARDGDHIKSMSKGPAAKGDMDPAVMSAASTRARGAPGL